jgi:hypothetical protein
MEKGNEIRVLELAWESPGCVRRYRFVPANNENKGGVTLNMSHGENCERLKKSGIEVGENRNPALINEQKTRPPRLISKLQM